MTSAATEPKSRGRPPAAPGEAKTDAILLRLTPALREKLQRLGGPVWLRERIEKARE